MHRRAFLLGGLGFAAGWQPARGFAQTDATPYKELWYRSGALNVQAYFYQPAGHGPFPLIIYNHGSRPRERNPLPFRYIGALFSEAGFATLVPERRGYGKSDGPTYTEEVGNDVGARLLARLRAETDDVFAALDHVKTTDAVDRERIGVAGWSLGGVISMFAIARGRAFKAALNQAGGALLWQRSTALQEAMRDAGRKAQGPVMLMAAQNDRTTNSVTEVAAAMHSANRPHEVKIYPPFTPPKSPGQIAPGHMIFDLAGAPIWKNDAIGFFDRKLRA